MLVSGEASEQHFTVAGTRSTSVWKKKNCSFLLHLFLLLKSFWLNSNMKHWTQCFITRPGETPRIFFKNAPLRVIFSTLFVVFHLVMKHFFSCLIYYSSSDPRFLLNQYNKMESLYLLNCSKFGTSHLICWCVHIFFDHCLRVLFFSYTSLKWKPSLFNSHLFLRHER